MKATVVIPARYGSSRFPGKPLAQMAGKPMIQWVYERSREARGIGEVIVATDDERIRRAVEDFGGWVQMTSSAHETGTDRIAEVAQALSSEVIVNVQGDEPLIRPDMIESALQPFEEDPSLVMGTLKAPLTSAEEWASPHVVKVVVDRQDFALYFSRAPIPYDRDGGREGAGCRASAAEGFKHVGLYAYRRDFLLTFAQLSPTPLERREKLEQLRALEHGYRIKVVSTSYEGVGVDKPEDLEKVAGYLDVRDIVEWRKRQ